MANGAEEPRNWANNPVIAVDCVRVDDGVVVTLFHKHVLSHTEVRSLQFHLPREQAENLLTCLQRDTAEPAS